MIEISNLAIDSFIRSGLVDLEQTYQFHPRTRDRDDITVLRCKKSGLIFLNTSQHITDNYYQDKTTEDKVAKLTSDSTVKDNDTLQRSHIYQSYVNNLDWLDIGCGDAQLLNSIGPYAKKAVGLDPGQWRNSNTNNTYEVVEKYDSLREKTFDVISLFHVLEHVPDQQKELQRIHPLLNQDGMIIIEVPHALDALIGRYECMPYRDHTFWSEHLILHTEESLIQLIEAEGFKIIEIKPRQRYPLSNHLHWLSQGKPKGQKIWQDLNSDGMDFNYESLLASVKMTDTITAIAKKI